MPASMASSSSRSTPTRQALLNSHAPVAVRIGDKFTKGLGAGGRPEVGARAAEESADTLGEMVRDADMVFITAGMGGGTGTGASPVIAKIAKAAGALTVGVVTKPFDFEGSRRKRVGRRRHRQLRDIVDALITIPNERLLHHGRSEDTLLRSLPHCRRRAAARYRRASPT